MRRSPSMLLLGLCCVLGCADADAGVDSSADEGDTTTSDGGPDGPDEPTIWCTEADTPVLGPIDLRGDGILGPCGHLFVKGEEPGIVHPDGEVEHLSGTITHVGFSETGHLTFYESTTESLVLLDLETGQRRELGDAHAIHFVRSELPGVGAKLLSCRDGRLLVSTIEEERHLDAPCVATIHEHNVASRGPRHAYPDAQGRIHVVDTDSFEDRVLATGFDFGDPDSSPADELSIDLSGNVVIHQVVEYHYEEADFETIEHIAGTEAHIYDTRGEGSRVTLGDASFRQGPRPDAPLLLFSNSEFLETSSPLLAVPDEAGVTFTQLSMTGSWSDTVVASEAGNFAGARYGKIYIHPSDDLAQPLVFGDYQSYTPPSISAGGQAVAWVHRLESCATPGCIEQFHELHLWTPEGGARRLLDGFVGVPVVSHLWDDGTAAVLGVHGSEALPDDTVPERRLMLISPEGEIRAAFEDFNRVSSPPLADGRVLVSVQDYQADTRSLAFMDPETGATEPLFDPLEDLRLYIDGSRTRAALAHGDDPKAWLWGQLP